MMKKFVKITTRNEDGSIVRTWIDEGFIHKLSQNSVTQDGNNEGTCEFIDEETIELIDFSSTLDSLI